MLAIDTRLYLEMDHWIGHVVLLYVGLRSVGGSLG